MHANEDPAQAGTEEHRLASRHDATPRSASQLDATLQTLIIGEYRPIAKALHDLYTRHAGVLHDCSTPKGMQACREARAEIRTCRTSLEAKRREIKAPALERCRLIDAEAKRITDALVAIEDPLDEQIKAEEEAAEARREEKRQAEMKRQAEIRRIVESITFWPVSWLGATAQQIRDAIARYERTDIPSELPPHYHHEAEIAKGRALQKLREMLAGREAKEAEEARLAAERRAELERQAAEDKRLREERAELDRQHAEHARIERELAEERARISIREAPGVPWEDFKPSAPASEPPQPVETEPGAIVMRVRFEKRGGHYHCRVFTAKRIGLTFAKNGDLVFDEAEWPDIPLLMRGAEFVEEKKTGWP